MERGIHTTEFWATMATAVLGVLKATVLPDLPDESFYAVIAYVLGRSGRKALTRTAL